MWASGRPYLLPTSKFQVDVLVACVSILLGIKANKKPGAIAPSPQLNYNTSELKHSEQTQMIANKL